MIRVELMPDCRPVERALDWKSGGSRNDYTQRWHTCERPGNIFRETLRNSIEPRVAAQIRKWQDRHGG
jgi:hypothetical protein